jgi:hypothetical protein
MRVPLPAARTIATGVDDIGYRDLNRVIGNLEHKSQGSKDEKIPGTDSG